MFFKTVALSNKMNNRACWLYSVIESYPFAWLKWYGIICVVKM